MSSVRTNPVPPPADYKSPAEAQFRLMCLQAAIAAYPLTDLPMRTEQTANEILRQAEEIERWAKGQNAPARITPP